MCLLCTSCLSIDRVFTVFPAYVDSVFTLYQLFIDRVFTMFPAYVDSVFTLYQLFIDRVFTMFPAYVDSVFTLYQLFIYRLCVYSVPSLCRQCVYIEPVVYL